MNGVYLYFVNKFFLVRHYWDFKQWFINFVGSLRWHLNFEFTVSEVGFVDIEFSDNDLESFILRVV